MGNVRNHKIERLLEDIRRYGDKQVSVYSFEKCPACVKLKKGLDAVGLRYENVNMDGNEEAWKMLQDMGGTDYVPQVIVDGKLINEYETVNELMSKIFTEVAERKIVIK